MAQGLAAGFILRNLDAYFLGGQTVDTYQIHTKKKQKDFQIADDRGKIVKKFEFTPGDIKHRRTLMKNFAQLYNDDGWNYKLSFLGYKGEFKYENWVEFEEQLRLVDDLKKISFIDTKLEASHLEQLVYLINWINPSDLSLTFKQNELDDQDMETFLLKNLLPVCGSRINSVVVTSNPGIYKGKFFESLQYTLSQLNLKDPDFLFISYKNDDTKSVGFVRVQKPIKDEDLKKIDQKFVKKLSYTFYYKLSFKKCFTDKNHKAFKYLIENAYKEDKLEQIESLDVANCNVGPERVFEKLCKKLSTSKGLLSLGFSGITQLIDNLVIMNLIGDRYDKLTLSHIDLSNNQGLQERGFFFIAPAILCKVKTFDLSGSMGQHLPVLVKLFLMVEAQDEINSSLQKQSLREKRILKASLQMLELSKFENYNRFDLCERLVRSFILNEFSAVTDVTVQNFDIGRVKAYNKVYDEFVEHIKEQKKKHPQLYENYKSPLKTIRKPNQTYRMEEEPASQFYLRYFFTLNDDFINIETIYITKSFRQTGREEGWIAALKKTKEKLEKQIDQNLTLKHFFHEDNQMSELEAFQLEFSVILFNDRCKIETFSIEKEEFPADFSFLDMGKDYYMSKPSGWMHTLKCLKINDLVGKQIDMVEFLDHFIYTDKVRLQELLLVTVDIYPELNRKDELIQRIEKWDVRLSLEILDIGDFQNGKNENSEIFLYNYLIINRNSALKKLTLRRTEVKNFTQCYSYLQKEFEYPNYQPLKLLNSVTFDGWEDLPQDQWQLISSIFIFSQHQQINHIAFKNLKILKPLIQGIIQGSNGNLVDPTDDNAQLITIEQEEEKQADKKEEINPAKEKDLVKTEKNNQMQKHLRSLQLEKCTLTDDILTTLMISHCCFLEILEIKECKEIDKTMEVSKNLIQNSDRLKKSLSMSIEQLIMENSKFESVELFEAFMKHIVLKPSRYRLKKLNLAGCSLSDGHMQVINTLFNHLKEYESKQNLKNFFRIREITMDNNPDISFDQWKDFFDNLYSVYKAEASIIIDHTGDLDELDLLERQDAAKLKALQKVQEEEFEKQNELENLKLIEEKDKQAEENLKILHKHELNLPFNITEFPKDFKMNCPTQLNEIKFFANWTGEDDVMRRSYDKLLRGFILFVNSQVIKIDISNLDMKLFLPAFQEAIKIIEYRSQKILNQAQYASQIKNIHFGSMKEDSDEILTELFSILFKRRIFNIENFNYEGSTSKVVFSQFSQIIQQALADGIYLNLKQLNLIGCTETLDEGQSLVFFKNIIFNKSIPLEIFKSGINLSLTASDDARQILSQHIVQQNYKPCLKELEIGTSLKETSTFQFYQNIFQLLIDGQLVQLEKLTFKFSDAQEPVDLLKNIENLMDLASTTIKEIVLDTIIPMNRQHFEFFQIIRKNLVKLKISKLGGSADLEPELNLYIEELKGKPNAHVQYKPCELDVTFEPKNSIISWCLQNFVFSDVLQWSKLYFRGVKGFQSIKDVNFDGHQFKFLKYLNINLSLLFNSSDQPNEESITKIARAFIYNEESMLEELILMQMHLKVPGVKALVAPAEGFRQKIQEQNRQSQVYLSLKRFCIYYSLYILDEGAKLLQENLVYFEYTRLERIELPVTNYNDFMAQNLCDSANRWLEFQKKYNRKDNVLPLKHFEIARNEFVQQQKSWHMLCDTFLFTDQCPYLEVLNIHFMSFTDVTAGYLIEKIEEFFTKKPKSYIWPVQRLNFSLNTALSAKGWRQISEKFFWRPQIELKELNTMSTMIDSQEKIDALNETMVHRALQYKDKKLPLHTYLTYNISLKQYWAPYLSPRPKDWQPIQDQSVAIDNTAYDTGIIDGVPESYGGFLSIFTKTLYRSPNITVTSGRWNKETRVKFPQYHMDVSVGLLRPASQLFVQDPTFQGHLPVDMKMADELANFFKYRENDGEAFPILLFFTPEAYKFYASKQSKIRTISFIPTLTTLGEQFNQFKIFEIWKNVRSSRTSLDAIYIDYVLDDDLIDLMFAENFNERDILNLIRMFPPSRIRLQNQLTLYAVKGIYSVMWDNYQFQYANIVVDKDIFLNVGIGYALREMIYANNTKNLFLKFTKMSLYKILQLFISPAEKYYFSDQIKDLNFFLSTQTRFFVILSILALIYYTVCVASAYLWQTFFKFTPAGLICTQGLSSEALYTYALYAFISFIVEAYLYRKIAAVIPAHAIKMGEDEIIDQNRVQPQVKVKVHDGMDHDEKYPLNNTPKTPKIEQNLPQESADKQGGQSLIKKQTTQGKKKSQGIIKNVTELVNNNVQNLKQSSCGRFLLQSQDLIVGQIAKFKLYNDIAFILTTYYCDMYLVALLAAIVSAISISFSLYGLIKFILVQCFSSNEKAKLISTKFINDFFSVGIVGRNVAITNLLDRVAPYNVTVIPNNYILRKIFPQLAGKSIGNSVKQYFIQFLLIDSPQILLQMYFVVFNALKHSDRITWGIYVTLANSCLSLFLSFVRFMAIRPSTISQHDFDVLAEQKQLQINHEHMRLLKVQGQILQKLSGDLKYDSNILNAEQEQQDEENLIRF